MGKETTRVMNALEDFVEKVMKELGTGLHTNLREDTPRDTGYAENNWVANTGTAFKGTAGTREEAEAGKLDFAPRIAGLAKIMAYKISFKVGRGEIHLTNNVDYIIDLNTGTSKQAPALFVEMAIDRTIRQVLAGGLV